MNDIFIKKEKHKTHLIKCFFCAEDLERGYKVKKGVCFKCKTKGKKERYELMKTLSSGF